MYTTGTRFRTRSEPAQTSPNNNNTTTTTTTRHATLSCHAQQQQQQSACVREKRDSHIAPLLAGETGSTTRMDIDMREKIQPTS